MNGIVDPGWYQSRRVLVTGGTGFIGRRVVARLLDRGVRVGVLARPGSDIPDDWLIRGVDLRQGDLEDPPSLVAACQGWEIVLHAAGFAHAWDTGDGARHWRVNAQGTRNLVTAAVAAGVSRLVHLSSIKAMGAGGDRCLDENWTAPPDSAYGRAKLAAEAAVSRAGSRHGLHAVNLRPALVYGPGAKGNLARLVSAVRRGRFPPLPEVGNRRSLVHVEDVTRAMLLAACHPAAAGGTYIVTDGQPYSTRELYLLIRRALGRPEPTWTVPVWMLRRLARAGDMAARVGWRPGFDSVALESLLGWACYCSDRVRRELGFQPTRTLYQAMAELVRSPGEAR